MKLELNVGQLRDLAAQLLARLSSPENGAFSGTEEQAAQDRHGVDFLSGIRLDRAANFTDRSAVSGTETDFLSLLQERGGAEQPEFVSERIRLEEGGGQTRHLAFTGPAAESSAPAERARSLEAASDYLRRDSRRYDADLEKY